MKFALVGLFVCAALVAQPPNVQFEVASVRAVSQDAENGAPAAAGVRFDGAQFHALLPLRGLVAFAYSAGPFQLEAPDWMATQWYEVSAALPEGRKRGEVPEMLQALLGERFHMKTHRQSKDLPVYALTVAAGGIRAKEDPLDPAGNSVEAASSNSETAGVSRLPRGATWSTGANKMEAKKFTIATLAAQLTPFMDRPVVDQTGLPAEAAFDFTLDLTEEDFLATRVRSAMAAGFAPPPQAMRYLQASGASLRAALEKHGLKLEAKKAPREVLVVDASDKAPSEN